MGKLRPYHSKTFGLETEGVREPDLLAITEWDMGLRSGFLMFHRGEDSPTTRVLVHQTWGGLNLSSEVAQLRKVKKTYEIMRWGGLAAKGDQLKVFVERVVGFF